MGAVVSCVCLLNPFPLFICLPMIARLHLHAKDHHFDTSSPGPEPPFQRNPTYMQLFIDRIALPDPRGLPHGNR